MSDAALNRRKFCIKSAGSCSLVGVVVAAGWSGKLGNDAVGGEVRLGPGASLGGRRPFPEGDPWNQDVSRLPAEPNSEALIRGVGFGKALHPDFGTTYRGVPNGIPYIVVSGAQERIAVRFRYAEESDVGPYPIPDDAPIEGGDAGRGDRHVLVVDRDGWMLYELFAATRTKDAWQAGSGAIFDLATNSSRPAGHTSADAAGLPIFPGLVRYDEVVEQRAIRHALRFTCARSRRAYIPPARHFASASRDPNLPPMGLRVRLKPDYRVSGFPPEARVILDALKTYGMILADNGGDWFLSGAPDSRWDDDALGTLKRVRGQDFEVVKMGPLTSG